MRLFHEPSNAFSESDRAELARKVAFTNFSRLRAISGVVACGAAGQLFFFGYMNMLALPQGPNPFALSAFVWNFCWSVAFIVYSTRRGLCGPEELRRPDVRAMHTCILALFAGIGVIFAFGIYRLNNPIHYTLFMIGCGALLTFPNRVVLTGCSIAYLYFLSVVVWLQPDRNRLGENVLLGGAVTVMAWIGARVVMETHVREFLAAKTIERQRAQLAVQTVELSDRLVEINEAKTEVEARNLQLARLNRELKTANQLKDDLLGIAAHDLRGPLGTIKGFAGILKRETDPESRPAGFIREIEQASVSMLHLVEQLLETARLEGGIEVSARPVEVSRVIETAVAESLPAAERKNQRILAAAAPVEVRADAALLGEVLRNLIENALKFSPPETTVRVIAELAGEVVRLIVSDEGPGLSESDRAGLFEKFRKLSARPTGGEPSSGLGLWIVRQLVELQNGRVFAENNPEQGCSFIIELPPGNMAEPIFAGTEKKKAVAGQPLYR
jgi:signal transduction histidine kinase